MNVDHMVDGQHVVRTHTHAYSEGRIVDTKTWIVDRSERYTRAEFNWSAPPSVIVVGEESDVKIFYSLSFAGSGSVGAESAYAQITSGLTGRPRTVTLQATPTKPSISAAKTAAQNFLSTAKRFPIPIWFHPPEMSQKLR